MAAAHHSMFVSTLTICFALASRLQLHNGMDPKHPLLIGIKGRVLDVREGADYYGPDGPYKVMAGRDASKAFAMMSLKEEDAMADLSGVPAENLKILDDWCVSSRRASHAREPSAAASTIVPPALRDGCASVWQV